MLNGKWSWPGLRDWLLVVSVMALAVGLGAMASGVLTSEDLVPPIAGTWPHPRSTSVSFGATDTGLVPCACPSPGAAQPRLMADPPAQREVTPILPPGNSDSRHYLANMDTLMRRHQVATVTTDDPYQASLNPAVYVPAAPPIVHNGSTVGVPRNERAGADNAPAG